MPAGWRNQWERAFTAWEFKPPHPTLKSARGTPEPPNETKGLYVDFSRARGEGLETRGGSLKLPPEHMAEPLRHCAGADRLRPPPLTPPPVRPGPVTLRASSPIRRDLRSWSLMMRKGRPYSSKARVPTDAMMRQQELHSLNQRRPRRNPEPAFLSREGARARAGAVQASRDLFLTWD